MKTKTPEKKRCAVYIVENGHIRRRWVDELALHVKGRNPKTLQGERLPDLVMLDTGTDQQAFSVLEFFCESAPIPPTKIPVQPGPWPNGRDVINGFAAVLVFQVLLALVDAVARAASL